MVQPYQGAPCSRWEVKGPRKLLCMTWGHLSPWSLFQLEKKKKGVPIMAQPLTIPTSIHEDTGLIPGLAQWVKDPALL